MASESSRELDAAEITRLLHRLDDVLNKRGHQALLYVVGGANMALAVDSRRSTTDVDTVVKQGFDAVFDAAAEVAQSEPGLSPNWLNAEFTGGTPDGGLAWSFFDNRDDDEPSTLFVGQSLTVELASPEMMLALKTLALKIQAQRDRDMDDIYALMRMTGIRTSQELGRNLVRFTGPRIIHEQQSPWMPHHIDPSFRFILDNAPDDLQPAPAPSRQGLVSRIFKKGVTGAAGDSHLDDEARRIEKRYQRFPELRPDPPEAQPNGEHGEHDDPVPG